MDLTTAKKARKAQDPTAQLRRESRATYAAGNRQDKDNLKAVIEYMKARGAFGEIDLEETTRNSMYSWKRSAKYTISPTVESLPWNPTAPKRITELYVSWKDPDTQELHRGRYRTVPGKYHSFTVKIPHWDYDGVDPLVAREPWERQDTNEMYNREAADRRSQILLLWALDAEVREMEAAEKLNASHKDIPNAARYDYCTGPEG